MSNKELNEAVEFLRKTSVGRLVLANAVCRVFESYAMFDPIGAFDFLAACVKENKDPVGFYPFLTYRHLSYRELLFLICADAITLYQVIDESLSLVKKGLINNISNANLAAEIESLDLMKVAEFSDIKRYKKPKLSVVR